MAGNPWQLQRGYAAVVYPAKRDEAAQPPSAYVLKTDVEFRRALSAAINMAERRPMSAVVFNMTDDRRHPVREAILKLAFGQTRTPLPAMAELATRLAQSTDRRTQPSLFIAIVDERGDARRVSMYVFPEESTYALRHSGEETAEAFLEHVNSFVVESRLRKVARFEGKKIKSHFLGGSVVDLQIGSSPRAVADYWVTDFLEASFAINDAKGTSLVAEGLKAVFRKANGEGRQAVMEAAMALMASGRRTWSLERIAKEYLPPELASTFYSVASNADVLTGNFTLSKELLRERINYRVFQLETGVWVSSPFSEVGRSVTVDTRGNKRTLIARGVIESERVRSNAKRSPKD
jgi:hypothetical protein